MSATSLPGHTGATVAISPPVLSQEPTRRGSGPSGRWSSKSQATQHSTQTPPQVTYGRHGSRGGPYLWADGATARSDGLTWTCDEVRPDGAHLETEGNVKVAELLMSFLEAEPTAAWMFSNRKLPPPPTDLGQPIPTSTIAGAAPPATTEVPDATTSTTAAPPDRTTTTRAPGEAQARPPSTDENDALPPVVWILIGAGSALLFTALGIRLRERRRGRRTE